ncbi:DUF6531 domain-containing protein [Streptomyces rubrogriseus]|uniref:Type IV secretion protein Rhs n=1 Tax=Streptomyces rubrogriseus TaxID=194673 RepID=A0A6G3TUH9_9ACTN|nr:hypothetical protein [Streptomyces rubrogriseus]
MVDLNPLHYINKFNHMFGDTVADGLEFLGITDPAVDPDGIRELAKKWRALAEGLDDAAEAARKSLADVEWEGKAAKALHKRAKSARKQATEMADSLREGAKALDDFADKAHELLSEIGVILAEIAELELAGLALSVLTGGTSAVVSTLMAGSRAAKVVALVARIEQEGTVLASAIRGVMEVIRAVERALKTLKEIRGVAAAGRMAKEGMKFSAFDTLLRDPEAFKDPEKLAGILTEGALLGVGFGALGKALGKGLKALKPADLAKLGKGLKLTGPLSRLKLRPSEGQEVPASIRSALKKCDLDPIDVATGDMLLPQVDVQLPGGLPLVLSRMHTSSYRWGGWFGPTWASVLDQRLQADDDGVVYAAPDGARLCFPRLAADSTEAVHAETDSRLSLSWDASIDGAMRITDPDTGLVHVFHSPQPVADETAVDLPLQFTEDRNGNRITVRYAETGFPTEIFHSGGYRISIDCHPSHPRVTALRLLDPERQDFAGTLLITYVYNDEGHLAEVINSSGLPMRFTYDECGRIESWSDRNGTSYAYTYDERGRVVRTVGSDGFLSGFLEYDDATRSTTVTNSVGSCTRYEHNAALRLIRQTDALGHVTEQCWDAKNRLTTIIDPMGQTTRLSYDENGRVTTVVRPDGHVVRTEYSDLGMPATLIGPDGATWFQRYDERGNQLSITDPNGATTLFAYDASGNLSKITDPLGAVTQVRCNRVGLPVVVIDPLDATTRFERDSFGRIVSVADALGSVSRMEWTVEGRLRRRVAADGSTESWCYDGEGNVTSHVDATGATFRLEYTHFDLATARIGADGERYNFAFDTERRLTSVTNPQGLTWNYEYDPVGNIAAETDFEGRRINYSYDAAGRLVSHVNALKQIVRYERDVLGQVTRKNVAGLITTYAYDLVGQLVHAASPDATLEVERDPLGLVLSERVNGCATTYDYDLLGRRTRRTTPSGAVSTWSYDMVGRVAALNVGGRTVDFEHNEIGCEAARHFGEEVTLANSFDLRGRLETQVLVHGVKGEIQRRDYGYRADSSLSWVEDRLNGAYRFESDAAGRVVGVDAANWTERYAYDEAGNQTQAEWPAVHPGHEATGPRTVQGTRVARAGNVRYEHDALGRTLLRQKVRLSRRRDTWRYEWDAHDRLASVTTPDGTRWRYVYDPLGRRIAKQRLSEDGIGVVEEVRFTWDGTTLCEQASVSPDSPHAVILTWEYRGLYPVAQTERVVTSDASQREIDSRFFAIVTDLVGTPRELFDESGNIAWRARSTIWGKTAWAADSIAYTPLRFPGQYFDSETGLHYNYFRYYDPEIARYLTLDPLGLAPAPNPATYVHDPHTWADPLGLKCPDLREGYSSQPAFNDPYNPDVVGQRILDMRKLYGIKEPPSAVSRDSMIGANGTQVTSKTMWNHGPYRIDVENPNPGQRAGQMHFQDQSNLTAKYQYDFGAGKFEGLPRSIEKEVGKSPGFRAGIEKGLRMLGEERS